MSKVFLSLGPSHTCVQNSIRLPSRKNCEENQAFKIHGAGFPAIEIFDLRWCCGWEKDDGTGMDVDETGWNWA